jgi:hypothetical protein
MSLAWPEPRNLCSPFAPATAQNLLGPPGMSLPPVRRAGIDASS